eukprot:scaffold16496_cov120-Isochrysis_galbana.AAC.2
MARSSGRRRRSQRGRKAASQRWAGRGPRGCGSVGAMGSPRLLCSSRLSHVVLPLEVQFNAARRYVDGGFCPRCALHQVFKPAYTSYCARERVPRPTRATRHARTPPHTPITPTP